MSALRSLRRAVVTVTCLILLACDGTSTDVLSAAAMTAGLDARPSNTTCVAPERPPAPAPVQLQEAFVGLELQEPLVLVQAPGAPERWYAVERVGRIVTFPNQPEVTSEQHHEVLDLRPQVRAAGEGGLLGLAFHPRFPQVAEIFVFYTARRPAESRLSRVALSPDGRHADADSEEVLLRIPRFSPQYYHNGGQLAFGPDGLLYVGVGDGAVEGQGDRQNLAQDPHVLLGKVLRLDVSQPDPGRGIAYSIPTDNPFAAGGGAPEIYALGFRNPWRWSFDRHDGALWVADVGFNQWEEVNVVHRGGNYGWRIREGGQCFAETACATLGLTDPVHQYDHDDGDGAIVGGFVYRGAALPALTGSYLFADYVSGRIWALSQEGATGPWRAALLLETGANIVAFAQDDAGEVYVLLATGQVSRLVPGPVHASDTFPATLRATGCVDPIDPRKAAPGLIPYDVNVPLWSDGAAKERWLALPDGTTMVVGPDGDWELPVGSVLLKSFDLGNTRVETRLLVRHADGDWAGYSYAWNEAQTDAVLLPGSTTRQVGEVTWSFPSRGQCLACHTAAAGRTLGLETAQLNRTVVYPGGHEASQLATLAHLEVVDLDGDAPEDLPALSPLDSPAPVAERARAYLHANCSHCHRPGGPGRGRADLRFHVDDPRVCNVAPVAGDLGVPGAVLLAPGSPDTSLVALRMGATTGGRMPPLATRVVHRAGLEVVRTWIADLDGCP